MSLGGFLQEAAAGSKCYLRLAKWANILHIYLSIFVLLLMQ